MKKLLALMCFIGISYTLLGMKRKQEVPQYMQRAQQTHQKALDETWEKMRWFVQQQDLPQDTKNEILQKLYRLEEQEAQPRARKKLRF